MGAKVDKIAMVRYGIDKEASDTEIAEHFGLNVKTWRCYKSDVRKTNPDLVDELLEAQTKSGKRRKVAQFKGKKVLDKFAMLQYGIDTGATDEEIIEHFGCTRIETWQTYKSRIKQSQPQLLEQLKQAQRERQMREKEKAPTITELQQENKRLKARIVLLEQELQEYRMGLRVPGRKKAIITPEKNMRQLYILLKAFDKGTISEEETRMLEEFYNKVSRCQIPFRYTMSHSNIMYAIRTVLRTTRADWEEKKEEIRKYISKEKDGPLYELESKTTLSNLAARIKMLSGIEVSNIQLVMIINQMIAEGQEHNISDRINREGIPMIRSKIESECEQLRQGLILGNEGR